MKKGFWISDRWGSFIWLQRLWESVRLSFGPLFALSVAEAGHVICFSSHWKPTPAVANKKIKTMLLSLSVAQQVNGYFSPHFPPFYFCFIFIGGLVLYPVPSGPQVKEAGNPSLVLFCREVRAENIYGYSYQRSCKPCLSTVWFWHFSFCWFWAMRNIVT